MTRTHEYRCWTCLDFEYLPDIGPCPDCQLDAYTEHITAWADEQADAAEYVGTYLAKPVANEGRDAA
jgi:hypothetical protein